MFVEANIKPPFLNYAKIWLCWNKMYNKKSKQKWFKLTSSLLHHQYQHPFSASWSIKQKGILSQERPHV